MGFFPRDLAAPVAPSRPVIEWEAPDCLLCGGRHWLPVVEASDTTTGGTGLWFAVVQCQDCGLCFTNPRPTPASMGQFYPPVYRPHQTPACQPSRLAGKPWKRLWRSRHVYELLPRHGQCRLLDFGCGGGSFLQRMHRRGWQVTGIDIAAAAVENIHTQLGLHALVGTLPHAQLKPACFDVITMLHSLEHVHDPAAALQHAHRLLVPGGKLVVVVPNIDSLPFRWFGPVWYGLDLPRHLTHFAPWTLQRMLERAGFRLSHLRMVRHSGWLRRSARRAAQSPDASFWHRWLTARTPARLATWYSFLTRQTDCMMALAER